MRVMYACIKCYAMLCLQHMYTSVSLKLHSMKYISKCI